MALLLDAEAPGFGAAFAKLVDGRREETVDVRDAVTRIVSDVRARGDAALVEATERFDRWRPKDAAALRVPAGELAAALDGLDPLLRESLEFAARRVRAFHERQLPENVEAVDEAGVRQAWRWSPVDAAGLYVPGGLAAYPSSLLMNAIPAKVAGVARLVVAVPTPEGVVNRTVLAAAALAGVDEVYRIGGAQAVAAMAFGTATVAPVSVITGPGNAYVAEAKRQVFGRVGIDMVAGPSEVVVVADSDNDPEWLAADLLSQAEHDERAQAILITDDSGLAGRVTEAVERQLRGLARAGVAEASWRDHGAVVVVPDLERALPLVDALAPEHLEIVCARAGELAAKVRHAGAIFVGAHTPEVIGDYVGGPNHVLPTGRTARFASGLSVFEFLKRTTVLECTPEAFGLLGGHARRLAEAEGLGAHAAAIALRQGEAS